MRRCTIALFAVVFLISACTSSKQDPQPPAGWPKGFEDFTIQWSAEPGIDLVNGPAVAARAYLESFQLATLTADEKYLYPGFADAVGPKPSDSSKAQMWPHVDGKPKEPWVGTQRNHILSITQSDNQIKVVGCMYTYSVGYQDSDGKYSAKAYPPGGQDAGIAPLGVVMTAPSATEKQGAQQGPARTPSDDVFGGYQVTGRVSGLFSSSGEVSGMPDFQQTLHTCVEKAPDPLDRRNFFTSKFHPRSDFPTSPPTPGWPASE